MGTLQKYEYDKSYFQGRESRYSHNGGYSDYDTMQQINEGIANKLFERFKLKDKKVLELGCAKGFLIKVLRDLEVEAYGLDFSEFAVNCSEVKEFITLGDARHFKELNFLEDGFDLIVSFNFLECLTEKEIINLVENLNKKSYQQCHRFNVGVNEKFYTRKQYEWWKNLPWKQGTILIDNIEPFGKREITI